MSVQTERREQRLDQRLGQLAVRSGRLTPERLREALEIQAEGLRRGRRKPRRLGVILAEKGWMSDAEVFALLEQQEAWALAQETRNREDGLLGRILVDAGLAEPAHVDEALREQAKAVGDGADPPPRLGELLVRLGHARPEDIEQALELQKDLETPPEPDPEPAPEPAPAPREAPGTPAQLGRYRLGALLGRGGMGEVYEGLDTQLDRKVAVKLLRSEAVGPAREKEVARLEREARMAARLPKHPGIAEVYEVGLHDGRHYIAMEFAPGVTFGEWRKSPGRSLRELVRTLRDVALAVQHAHEHGVLHRDLKPGNVLVEPKGKPCVVDFGLARPSDAEGDLSGLSGVVCGTVSYMSPEQAQGRRDLDARCDVYALGVMLYEVLAGRTPTQGENREEVLRKLRSPAVAPPGGFARSRGFSSVDAAVEKICLKALAPDRERRTPSARALADELAAWLESREKQGPVLAAPAETRRRRRILLASAAAAALLLPLGFALAPRGEPEAADLRRARGLAEGGRPEEALAVYEGILRRAPDHDKARQGRDVMMRHLISEAARDVEDAAAKLDRARSALAEADAALRNASLATDRELRDRREAAARGLREAEQRLAAAREALKRWSTASR
jgi:predicted Ser/Thr protein kinase